MAFEPGMTVGSLLVSIVIVAAGFVLAGEPATTKLWRTCGVGFIGGCGVSVMVTKHTNTAKHAGERLIDATLTCVRVCVAGALVLTVSVQHYMGQ